MGYYSIVVWVQHMLLTQMNPQSGPLLLRKSGPRTEQVDWRKQKSCVIPLTKSTTGPDR